MFLNFITIQYALMLERIPALQSIFSNIVFFAAAVVAIYMPLAIIVGYWHRKTQWKVEQEALFHENVIQARMYLFLIKLVEGRTTEQERKEMQEMLEKIMRKLPSEPPKKKDTGSTEAA
jgi:magnesium-transporting ATPase (P-type)